MCESNAVVAYGPVLRCSGFVEGNLRCPFTYTDFLLLDPDDDNVVNDYSASTMIREEPLSIPERVRKMPIIKKLNLDGNKKRKRVDSDEDWTQVKPKKGTACTGLFFTSIGSMPGGVAGIKSQVEANGGTWQTTLKPNTTAILVPETGTASVKTKKKFLDSVDLGIPALLCSYVDALCHRKTHLGRPKKRRTADAEEADRSRGIVLRSRKFAAEYMVGPVKSFAEPMPSIVVEKNEERRTMRPSIKPGSDVLLPEPEAGPKYSVYVDDFNDAYNAPCNVVDIGQGVNKFYKIAVYRRGEKWFFLRKWGRVDDKSWKQANNFLLEEYDKEECIAEFLKKFTQLTGKPFEERFDGTPVPGRHRFLELDGYMWEGNEVEQAEAENVAPEDHSPGNVDRCDLNDAVQALVLLLFSKQLMEEQLAAQHLDLKKMPLGKISRRQLNAAYAVLKELQNLLTEGNDAKENKRWHTIVQAKSNNFYEIIPHAYTLKYTPVPIASLDMLKDKVDVMESLLQVSVANSLMSEALVNAKKVHPLVAQYDTLKADISVVSSSHHDFPMLERALSQTHGSTHMFRLTIQEAFEIRRAGERERNQKFTDVTHRRLLWHGSRTSNFASIICKGLLIAPPEAPVNGYMFGKGVYFADSVSKSAQYCCHSTSHNEGLVMLCEVALGDPLLKIESDSKAAENCTAANCLHTFAIGRTAPAKEEKVASVASKHSVKVFTDCMGPNARGLRMWNAEHKKKLAVEDLSLLYNEYIVYDVAQVVIRYLLRVKFESKDDSESDLDSAATAQSTQSDSDESDLSDS